MKITMKIIMKVTRVIKVTIKVLTVTFFSLYLTSCASKKKADSSSVLTPDGADPMMNQDGGILDATNMIDQPMSSGAVGSDSGSFSGLQTINFAYDVSSLSEESKAILKSSADWMNANSSVNVQIEGHCDERGSVEYNMALGERRAKATKDYLVSLGVTPSQLITISYGEEKLLEYGDTEEAHSKNRRANFLPLQ